MLSWLDHSHAAKHSTSWYLSSLNADSAAQMQYYCVERTGCSMLGVYLLTALHASISETSNIAQAVMGLCTHVHPRTAHYQRHSTASHLPTATSYLCWALGAGASSSWQLHSTYPLQQ